MKIDFSNFNALEPFIYSRIMFVPNLDNPSVKICVGVIVYSEYTKEYLYRRADNGNVLKELAEDMYIDVLEDFFSDFKTLEYLYRPEIGTALENYPDWLTAAAGELKGIIRITQPAGGMSTSLLDGLKDIFELTITETEPGYDLDNDSSLGNDEEIK